MMAGPGDGRQRGSSSLLNPPPCPHPLLFASWVTWAEELALKTLGKEDSGVSILRWEN